MKMTRIQAFWGLELNWTKGINLAFWVEKDVRTPLQDCHGLFSGHGIIIDYENILSHPSSPILWEDFRIATFIIEIILF